MIAASIRGGLVAQGPRVIVRISFRTVVSVMCGSSHESSHRLKRNVSVWSSSDCIRRSVRLSTRRDRHECIFVVHESRRRVLVGVDCRHHDLETWIPRRRPFLDPSHIAAWTADTQEPNMAPIDAPNGDAPPIALKSVSKTG